ncbi:MAG: 23S rRNA (adenine(2503)-C(2))-methyltransferase RlmN [Firmicutes bacterium]|nr:23S rRNA (adenine(2503)-C(2))-methyltransferase RlmN [Bacillota bacterium]
MLPNELETLVLQLNSPKYRATQIFEWLHSRFAVSFDVMDNLPKSLRQQLSEVCYIPLCQPIETLVSEKDSTKKFLFALSDDLLIEAVLMEYSFGNSVCISTQAGCKMGCKFCASGADGLIRNLTAGEMLAQVYAAKQEKISGVVLMGCGEPLDNFDNVVRFLELISHPKGLNIGKRHITISTCGLVPQIKKLANLQLPINLAISLHATDDQLRQTIMPIAKKYSIYQLLEACRYYTQLTNRRITFEYALISNLNDSPNHAMQLAKLLEDILCHVNLIPVNMTNAEFLPTLREHSEKFMKILQENDINATIRRTMGEDLDAACGQLRAKKMQI